MSPRRISDCIKNCLLSMVWNGPCSESGSQSIENIDLRADKISGTLESLLSIFGEIFSIPADDGLVFDLASLKARKIKKQDEYLGTNISITALLGNTRLPVSIGFGDVIVPSKKEMSFPVLLDMKCSLIYGNSIESVSVLAEKFEAIVSLGYANSRFKDFYDIYVILQSEKIDAELLQEAIVQTFQNRKTTFDDIVVFEDSFATDVERVKRWNAFVKKKNALVQVTFDKVVEQIKTYFKPIVDRVG